MVGNSAAATVDASVAPAKRPNANPFARTRCSVFANYSGKPRLELPETWSRLTCVEPERKAPSRGAAPRVVLST